LDEQDDRAKWIRWQTTNGRLKTTHSDRVLYLSAVLFVLLAACGDLHHRLLVDMARAVPVEAPSGIKPDSGLVSAPDASLPGAVEGGVPDGVAGSGFIASSEPPPPPPPTPTAPVRPGGDLRPPTRTRNVQPVYPAIAQSARVQGVVVIEAVIGTDGKVRDARVLRSIPLLDQAALDAVRQWEYTPSRLNGVPVPVVMTVTVNFTLR
jgi:protein TonB